MSNLFNGTTPEIDPNHDYLSELVGEGKKYRDIQALALSKVHADRMIDELKQREAEAQQELQTRKRLEELLDKAAQPKSHVEPNPVNPDQTRNDPNMNDLTAEKIESLISERLTQHERNRSASENVRTVKNAMIEQFGNNYEDVATKAAQAAGVTVEWLNEQAAVNPKLVLSIVQMNAPKKESFVTPPTSKLNPDIAPQGEVRNLAYYQKIKARDKKYYDSPEVQSQMEKDAFRLREAFWS